MHEVLTKARRAPKEEISRTTQSRSDWYLHSPRAFLGVHTNDISTVLYNLFVTAGI